MMQSVTMAMNETVLCPECSHTFPIQQGLPPERLTELEQSLLETIALGETIAKLKAQDRQREEFLAMLGHELRGPLGVITNATSTLRLLRASDRREQPVLDLVDRQVTHLACLVDDLYDSSRILQGRIHLNLECLELALIVERALENSRPALKDRNHILTVSLPTEPLLLEGDLIRLTQVVSNLVHNAAKYTSNGGNIWISGELTEGEVILRVTDNGVGIAPEVLPHIFDLFFTLADRSLGQTRAGLGVGLFLVKRLVEAHGGGIEARSGGRGQGSEFIIRLPALRERGDAKMIHSLN